jgi:hypothetical protein
MGRRGHPAELRRRVLGLVEAGRPIAEVAKALRPARDLPPDLADEVPEWEALAELRDAS